MRYAVLSVFLPIFQFGLLGCGPVGTGSGPVTDAGQGHDEPSPAIDPDKTDYVGDQPDAGGLDAIAEDRDAAAEDVDANELDAAANESGSLSTPDGGATTSGDLDGSVDSDGMSQPLDAGVFDEPSESGPDAGDGGALSAEDAGTDVSADPVDSVDVLPCNRAVQIEAGPLWNHAHAAETCPAICEERMGLWTGHWWTTERGTMSVCQCQRACRGDGRLSER